MAVIGKLHDFIGKRCLEFKDNKFYYRLDRATRVTLIGISACILGLGDIYPFNQNIFQANICFLYYVLVAISPSYVYSINVLILVGIFSVTLTYCVASLETATLILGERTGKILCLVQFFFFSAWFSVLKIQKSDLTSIGTIFLTYFLPSIVLSYAPYALHGATYNISNEKLAEILYENNKTTQSPVETISMRSAEVVMEILKQYKIVTGESSEVTRLGLYSYFTKNIDIVTDSLFRNEYVYHSFSLTDMGSIANSLIFFNGAFFFVKGSVNEGLVIGIESTLWFVKALWVGNGKFGIIIGMFLSTLITFSMFVLTVSLPPYYTQRYLCKRKLAEVSVAISQSIIPVIRMIYALSDTGSYVPKKPSSGNGAASYLGKGVVGLAETELCSSFDYGVECMSIKADNAGVGITNEKYEQIIKMLSNASVTLVKLEKGIYLSCMEPYYWYPTLAACFNDEMKRVRETLVICVMHVSHLCEMLHEIGHLGSIHPGDELWSDVTERICDVAEVSAALYKCCTSLIHAESSCCNKNGFGAEMDNNLAELFQLEKYLKELYKRTATAAAKVLSETAFFSENKSDSDEVPSAFINLNSLNKARSSSSSSFKSAVMPAPSNPTPCGFQDLNEEFIVSRRETKKSLALTEALSVCTDVDAALISESADKVIISMIFVAVYHACVQEPLHYAQAVRKLCLAQKKRSVRGFVKNVKFILTPLLVELHNLTYFLMKALCVWKWDFKGEEPWWLDFDVWYVIKFATGITGLFAAGLYSNDFYEWKLGLSELMSEERGGRICSWAILGFIAAFSPTYEGTFHRAILRAIGIISGAFSGWLACVAFPESLSGLIAWNSVAVFIVLFLFLDWEVPLNGFHTQWGYAAQVFMYTQILIIALAWDSRDVYRSRDYFAISRIIGNLFGILVAVVMSYIPPIFSAKTCSRKLSSKALKECCKCGNSSIVSFLTAIVNCYDFEKAGDLSFHQDCRDSVGSGGVAEDNFKLLNSPETSANRRSGVDVTLRTSRFFKQMENAVVFNTQPVPFFNDFDSAAAALANLKQKMTEERRNMEKTSHNLLVRSRQVYNAGTLRSESCFWSVPTAILQVDPHLQYYIVSTVETCKLLEALLVGRKILIHDAEEAEKTLMYQCTLYVLPDGNVEAGRSMASCHSGLILYRKLAVLTRAMLELAEITVSELACSPYNFLQKFFKCYACQKLPRRTKKINQISQSYELRSSDIDVYLSSISHCLVDCMLEMREKEAKQTVRNASMFNIILAIYCLEEQKRCLDKLHVILSKA